MTTTRVRRVLRRRRVVLERRRRRVLLATRRVRRRLRFDATDLVLLFGLIDPSVTTRAGLDLRRLERRLGFAFLYR